MSRQHSVTALEVLLKEWKLFHWPGSNTLIWTTTHTHTHTYAHTNMWCLPLILWWSPYTFHFFVVILNRTINLSTSKLPVKVNKAQLSNQFCFSFFRFLLAPRRASSLMARNTLLSQFLSSVARVKWLAKQHITHNTKHNNQIDALCQVMHYFREKNSHVKQSYFCNFLNYNLLGIIYLLTHYCGWSRFRAYLCNKPVYQLVGHHHWFVGPQMIVLIPGWV